MSVCSGSSSSMSLLALMNLKATQYCNHDNIMQIHSSPERTVCSPRENECFSNASFLALGFLHMLLMCLCARTCGCVC